MEAMTLLYVSDRMPRHTIPKKGLESFKRLGFEAIIIVEIGKAAQPMESVSIQSMAVRVERIKGDGQDVARVIRDMVAKESVSLVAVAMTEDSRRRTRRSTARRLIFSSKVPVLVLPHEYEPPSSEDGSVVSNVVYATDWSRPSEKAFDYILEFKENIRTLEIVNVVSSKLSVREMRRVKRRLMETRQKFIDEHIDAEFHVYAGKRPKEIVLAARDYGAGCVVMGGDGNSLIRRWLGKDCVSQVMKRSPVPVLVVA
mgnify:CR=1 FL=1